MGVGAIVGTGILTLIGVGAGLAGPAVLTSFALAGLVCACAALAYAELSTMMPQAGSAYAYSYAVLGEVVAWVVGWSLILEYSLVVSAVAVGWSGYAIGFLAGLGIDLPTALTVGPHVAGGLVNLPAVAIIAVVTGLLLLGTRESATLNAILVVIKVAALIGFVAIALPAFDAANFTPFMPNGFGSPALPFAEVITGKPVVQTGVMAAAAIIFFAFYGFDAISTAAEEARNPSRDLTIGIVGSMVACAAIYMLVAAAALGASPIEVCSKSGEPLAFILRDLGSPLMASVIGWAAILALPTVIMVFMFGQTRVFFAMARDGLLPKALATVGPRGVPVPVTLFTGVVAAVIAGGLPLQIIAELANAGTLAAFVATAGAMMVLRAQQPGLERPFRTPLWWVVGPVAIAGCLYLFWSLPDLTKQLFAAWNLVGVLVYLAYGRTRSNLAT